MLVLLCNTPRKDNQKQWRWFNLGVWGLGVFVDVLLIWVDSKISTINLMTGMILKLILNVFKKKKKLVCFLIENWYSVLTLLPLSFPPCAVDLFGRGEWGLCRCELSEDMNTNGNTSHISIEPPIQKRIPFLTEPLSEQCDCVVLHMLFSQAVDLCYSSRKL